MNFRVKVSASAIIFILYIAFSGLCTNVTYGQVSVKKWADDRKSVFTFTFDDASMTQYTYVAPVLDSFGFKGTFFVITGSNYLTDDLPANYPYGTWKQFRSMSLEGHEIGSHTVTHPSLITLTTGDTSTPGTLLYELHQSKKSIEQKISNQKCITIAYPDLDYDSLVINKTSQFYESARSGANYPMDSSLTGTDFYKIGAYEEEFNLPRNSLSDDLDELQDFETYLQSSISLGKWGLIEAHEVVPFSLLGELILEGSWYPITTEWLTSLCQWLKQRSDSNQVWVETFGNITRYMKEREHFQYNYELKSATQIKINPTDNLNNQIYNYPLTVDITVPNDWKSAIVSQGSNTDTIITFIDGPNTYVRAYVIPNGGILILDKIDFVPVLNLTAMIQGLYNGSTMVSDTVTVELHNTSSPFTLVDSRNGVLDSTGVGTFTFSNPVIGTPYYLVIKHRNAIETWSAIPQAFSFSSLSYDFTTAAAQAYGNNMVLRNGKYCLYSGDITQDGQVSFSDIIIVDNDNLNFVTGYTNTDINGDGQVSFSDIIIVDNNNLNFIKKIVPAAGSPSAIPVNGPPKIIGNYK